jgi:hypothetical protein
MNYQPSFSMGPTGAPVDPESADFDWLAVPHGDAPREDSARPHSWPRALAGNPARDGTSEEGAARRDEASTRAPRSEDGEAAKGNKGEPKPEPPRRRVPDSDIIDVGPRPTRTASEALDVRDLFPVPAKAPLLPSAVPDAFGRHRFMKPLLAFLVLEIVVSAGIYFGKRYAEAQVIVVPATPSGRSVIT